MNYRMRAIGGGGESTQSASFTPFVSTLTLKVGDKTAWQSFHPAVGLINTGRSLVDNLALGQLGISGLHCPGAVVPAVLLLLGASLAWWWRPVAERRLLWL